MQLGRLTKRSEFVAVSNSQKKIVTTGLVLQALKRDSFEHGDNPRLGFTVTKRVGNAVVRNRIRRRLRAIAKEIMPDLATVQFDYVCIGRKAAFDRPYEKLYKDFSYALHQLHKG